MSVVAGSLAKISPIFREPSFPIRDPSITHRWTNGLTVTGDASGGGLAIQSLFPADGSLSQFALWDFRFFGFWNSGAIAAMTSYLTITPGEPDYPAGYGIQISFQNDTYRPYQLFNALLPDFKFRISTNPSFPSLIQLVGSPNTNGVVTLAMFGGYIYDERMI